MKSTFRFVVIPRSLQASLPQCRINSEKYAASLTRDRTFLKRLSDFIGRLTSSLYAATHYREFISSACCVFVNKLILPKAADLLGGPYFVKKVFKKSGLFKLESVIHENVPFPDYIVLVWTTSNPVLPPVFQCLGNDTIFFI